MAVLHGTKALEAWCQIVTKDYSNVNITNMTSSWRSGLGFCALIHHFRPELLDYSNLNPENAFENNALAFTIAEQHLGINALLDPADMVHASSLDRLSILTYLSQFYQAFGGATTRSHVSNHVKSPFIKPMPRRESSSAGGPCQFCQKPVLFLLERYNINGFMAHRTCFKCARCGSQLSLANYYETEKGDFCCEICPDEEVSQAQLALTNKLKRESQEKELEEKEEEEEEVTSLTPQIKNENDVTSSSPIEPEEDKEKSESSVPCDEKEEHEEKLESSSTQEKEKVPPISEELHQTEKDEDPSCLNEKTVEEIPSKGSSACNSPSSSNRSSINLEKTSDIEEKDVGDVNGTKSVIEDKEEEAPDATKISLEESQSPSDEDEECRAVSLDPVALIEEKVDPSVGKLEDIDSNEDQNEFPEDNHQITSTTLKDPEKDLEEIKEGIASAPSQESKGDDETGEDKKSISENNQVEDDDSQGKVLEQEKVCDEEPCDYPEDLNPFDIEDPGAVVDNTKAIKEIENQSKSGSLNPFGSDFEDEENDQVRELTPLVPPPKPPRASHHNVIASLNPFGSDFEDSDGDDSRCKSGFRSVSPSPSCSSSMTIRSRKKRRAPMPPGANNHLSPSPLLPSDNPKSLKERDNINRRSQISNLNLNENNSSVPLTPVSPDKADGGIWKKKKGPAPPRPIPPKRQVKKIPRKAVNTELIDIEVKQLEFERQGVQLEKTIRELCEKKDSEQKENGSSSEDRESLGPEAEDLIIQLFELVNEKNELFRRQTELMYMKREHRLEEEHADLEYQIRVLMNKENLNEDQKKEEEGLISRLMYVVAQRNEIVDCLEMDRLRELEEDESIEIHMGEFAAVKPPMDSSSEKKKKKKNKEKKSKNKSFDVDKDIDTKEFPNLSMCGSPKPSPKKDKAKKLKKKLLSSMTSLASVKR